MSEDGTRALRVLVVDDGRLVRETTVRQLRDAGFPAEAVDNGYRALEELAGGLWDVVVCDLRMPGIDGLELLRTVRARHPEVEVILMTAFGTVKTAVTAMQDGAADYLTKPFHFQELEHRLRRLQELQGYRREVSHLRALLDEEADCGGILGRSPGMLQVIQLVRTFAEHTAPVLITGETGTGKELVARALHEQGARRKGPFVAIPCGAIPTELAESELFGHEKGSFTGATRQRQGAFERANGGTLLLDDVDDLPLGLQVKLLRALQEGSFLRIGGQRETTVDVRVVATSKVDLGSAVTKGKFRDDVFYRLRGLEIRLPPLRERGEDTLLLAQHYLRRFALEARKDEAVLSPEAARCLRRYAWPGNVRELRHAMESAVIVCPRGSGVVIDHLPGYLQQAREEQPTGDLFTLHLEGRETIPFADVVHHLEDDLIQWAMQKAGGQQTKAGELLGLARTTFQSKLGRGQGPG
ncbi:MAG: sigma-54-dependent transcriptional regulator [Myxococcota bacterium]